MTTINNNVGMGNSVNFKHNDKKEVVSDNKQSTDKKKKTNTMLMIGATALAAAMIGTTIISKGRAHIQQKRADEFAKSIAENLEAFMNKKRKNPNPIESEYITVRKCSTGGAHVDIEQGSRNIHKELNADGKLDTFIYRNGDRTVVITRDSNNPNIINADFGKNHPFRFVQIERIGDQLKAKANLL